MLVTAFWDFNKNNFLLIPELYLIVFAILLERLITQVSLRFIPYKICIYKDKIVIVHLFIFMKKQIKTNENKISINKIEMKHFKNVVEIRNGQKTIGTFANPPYIIPKEVLKI